MIGDKWLSIRNDRKKGMSYSEIGRKSDNNWTRINQSQNNHKSIEILSKNHTQSQVHP